MTSASTASRTPSSACCPKDFGFYHPDVKVWLPVAFTAQQKSDDERHSNNWSYVARLKSDATIEQARQQIDALNARNLDRFPSFKQILINAGFHTVVVPLQDFLVRDMRSTLYLLWGGVVFVLLVGAVNVTNLMLVRSSARMKELATRHALGAGLGRIARQLLTETMVLALAGGALGLGLGYAGVRALSAFGLEATPQGTQVAIDATVIAFTFGLALALAILIGLIPVLGLRQMNLSQSFREEGRSGTASRGARVTRRVLVTAQIAFAFMLLIGAGLLLASFQRVLGVRPGFDASHVLTGIVSPPASRYKDDAQLIAFWNRLADRVRALPGVQSAGIANSIPLGGNYNDSVILAEGYAMAPGESLISPYNSSVSPGYFETMAIPAQAGPAVHRVRRRAGGEGPHHRRTAGAALLEGRRIRSAGGCGSRTPPEEFKTGPGPKSRYFTVVGVVGNVRTTGLTEKEPVGAYYFPFAQNVGRGMTLVTRTAGDPSSIVGAIRQQVTAIDPGAAVLRGEADAAARRRVARQPQDADDAGQPVRRHRALPGRGRDLRRAGLPGGAAPQGDRDPHGARQRRAPDLRLDRDRGALAARRSAWLRASRARSRSGGRWRHSCSGSSRWIRRCSRS